jgi:hypothetical protein
VAGLAESGGEPFETLVETITRGSASGLDVLLNMELVMPETMEQGAEGRAYPGTLSQAVEAKLVGNLGGVHGVL